MRISERYIKEMDWRDFTLLKFCLFSVGMLFGLHFNGDEQDKKSATIILMATFFISYIPLMKKLFDIAMPSFASHCSATDIE